MQREHLVGEVAVEDLELVAEVRRTFGVVPVQVGQDAHGDAQSHTSLQEPQDSRFGAGEGWKSASPAAGYWG